MKINFDQNEKYCIYLGGLQSGKSFVFKSMDSDSIHFSNELRPKIINVLSTSDIFEKRNILGLHEYLTALKPKLENCYILETDFPSQTLKHINDIIVKKDNPVIYKPQNIQNIINVVINSYFFVLKFLKDNSIPYRIKNILELSQGNINVPEFFAEEIQEYDLRVLHENHLKMDYEWTYEKYAETIERNLLEIYNAKEKIGLKYLLETVDTTIQKYKILYEI